MSEPGGHLPPAPASLLEDLRRVEERLDETRADVRRLREHLERAQGDRIPSGSGVGHYTFTGRAEGVAGLLDATAEITAAAEVEAASPETRAWLSRLREYGPDGLRLASDIIRALGLS